MIYKLLELKDKYNEVKQLQNKLIKSLNGKEINFMDKENKYFFDENCSNIRVKLIDVPEDCIEVLYTYIEEDGEKVECVEFIEIDDFVKCAELK